MNSEKNLIQQKPFSYKKEIFKKTTTCSEIDKNGRPIAIVYEKISELYSEDPFNNFERTSELILNQEQINFLENEIIAKKPQDESEFGTQSIWMNCLLEWLKQQSIAIIAQSLEYLINKGIDWAIDGAEFALEKLQDFLFEKYLNNPNLEQKEIFKNKILEKFPNSSLASKLEKKEN